LELKFTPSDGWSDQRDESTGSDVSVRLANQKFQVRYSTIIEGFDALEAFVGLCEYDLAHVYSADVREVHCLQATDICDTIWHVKKQTHWGNEDNIMHLSCIDALDEPIGGLWCSMYTPAEENIHTLNGANLPRTEEGSVRVGFWHCSYIIEPAWTNPPSCKLTFGISRRPSSAAYIFSAVMRREVEKIVSDFKAFLGKTPGNELNWRALFSPMAPFYDCVRRHLLKKLPSHIKKMKMKGIAGYMPSANPMMKLTFEELSQKLPVDWGNYHEEIAKRRPSRYQEDEEDSASPSDRLNVTNASLEYECD